MRGGPVQQAKAIVGELKNTMPSCSANRRWLVLNKIDMVPGGTRCAVQDFVKRL